MSQSDQYRSRLKDLKCIVVIPTYNNAGTIAKVISDVREYSDDVLVVNDGSTDETSNILHSIEGIEIIEYPKNKGKGHALRLALDKACEMGFVYAITIDADGQHFADDIPVFIERIENVPGSLLIGARNLTADNMPAKNTFANKFSNFWYKMETWKTLSDTQSGYRLYPLKEIHGIRLITGRYEFEVEIIVRATWKGVNVENVPIKVCYPEDRVSHFRPFRDFMRISLLNTALVLGALLIYYPWKFIKNLTKENIKRFIDTQIIHCQHSNIRLAAAMGWGVFCGIIPIWGYQMIFAAVSSRFLKLNTIVTLVFSNISIPPMIPFILYGSLAIGSFLMQTPIAISFSDISLKSIGLSLTQYIIGSFVLAFLAGAVTMLIAWLVMTICKRGRR